MKLNNSPVEKGKRDESKGRKELGLMSCQAQDDDRQAAEDEISTRQSYKQTIIQTLRSVGALGKDNEMKTNVLRILFGLLIAAVFFVSGTSPIAAQAKQVGDLALSPKQVASPADHNFTIYLPQIANGSYDETSHFPSLDEFSASVIDGQSEVVRGVYVQDVLALRVVQQPKGDPGYIDSAIDSATQFQTPAKYGTVGLLAHNDLAGALFFDLKFGLEVKIIYGDGSIERFNLDRIKQYQVIQPYNPYSDMIDLDTGEVMSSYEVFREVYKGDEHVTFVTCIDNEGIPTWGRIYIIGTPIQ